MSVSFGLANYNTGDHILDLPVMAGASWAAMLNKPDLLSCEIDLRDSDVRALDIPSSTEPKVTVLFAQAESGAILAWGPISDRVWDNDTRKLSIEASGGWQYFNQRIIAPPSAETGEIILPDGAVSTAFDTKFLNTTLGGTGVQLVEQALAWPGAPTAYELPAPVAGDHESDTYRLIDFKRVGAALTDLTNRENGPDFAFVAKRDETGLSLVYEMRVGDPLLGALVGSWQVDGPASPVSGLQVTDDGTRLATHVWMQAGKTDSKVIVARARNDYLLDLAGYPVLDMVDTTHTDVTIQATLDEYAAENAATASRLQRSLSFSVRGDAEGLALGQYRPGDFAQLDVAAGNPYLAEGLIGIRITGISGNETGEFVKIGCEVGELT